MSGCELRRGPKPPKRGSDFSLARHLFDFYQSQSHQSLNDVISKLSDLHSPLYEESKSMLWTQWGQESSRRLVGRGEVWKV